MKCKGRVEVFSRVTGFYRPVEQWNKGKVQEFKDRKNYVVGQPELSGGTIFIQYSGL